MEAPPIQQKDPHLDLLIQESYKVQNRVAGGNHKIYTAIHLKNQTTVTIHFLATTWTEDENGIAAFLQRAKAAASIKHPQIVNVLDFGILPSTEPFIVTEWFAGPTLSEHLSRRGPLSIARSQQLILAIADALEFAHSMEIYAPCLDPDHILFMPDTSSVRLRGYLPDALQYQESRTQRTCQAIDVALSSLTTYMAPELIDGAPLTARADIYMLGILWFDMLAGRPPFYGQNAFDTAMKHASAPVPRISDFNHAASIPDSLEAAINRMLAKEPRDRFQSIEELRKAVTGLAIE